MIFVLSALSPEQNDGCAVGILTIPSKLGVRPAGGQKEWAGSS